MKTKLVLTAAVRCVTDLRCVAACSALAATRWNKSFLLSMVICLFLSSILRADLSVASSDSATWDLGSPFVSTISVAPNETISDVFVELNFEHSYLGEIQASLTHVETGSTITLLDASGDSSNLGVDILNNDDLDPANYLLADFAATDILTAAGSLGDSDEVSAGVYQAQGGASLAAAFAGESTQGDWVLTLSDIEPGEDGFIDGWGLRFTSTAIPEPSAIVVLSAAMLSVVSCRRRRELT